MMKLSKKMAALVVTMVITASLAVANAPQVVLAADEWGAPTERAWSDSLTSFNLKPPSEGGNYKMIQFGEYQRKPVNWYIANSDGTTADLFAYSLKGDSESVTAPFGTSRFHGENSEWKNHPISDYLGGTNIVYEQGAPKVTTVHANHYGASLIRHRLNNTSNGLIVTAFTEAEREKMMVSVPITIPDYKNRKEGGRSLYTVSDKLYLANADPEKEDIYIYLGSNGELKVPICEDEAYPYGGYTHSFWTAAPWHNIHDHDELQYHAMAARLPKIVCQNNTDNPENGICPACRLNLTSNLFFSAVPVPAAKSEIVGKGILSGSEAFIIRHEATDTTRLAEASVIFNEEEIQADTGFADSATLVVQWNDGTNDYFYEQIVEWEDEVSVSDIMEETGCAEGTLSEDCKVWLEYTDEVSRFTYAKLGTFEPTMDISGATVTTGNEPPVYDDGNPVDKAGFGVTVTLDGNELVEDTDYDLHYYKETACTEEVAEITDAGVYYVKAVGKGRYSGETTPPTKVKVNKKCLPKLEAVGGTITYDGTEKTGVKLPEGIDASMYKLTGDKATEAGMYIATASLADPDNYCWTGEDQDPEAKGTSEPFDINWTVEQAPLKEYRLLDGDGQMSDKSKGESATFRSEGAFAEFKEVQVDQKTVDPNNYEAREGSTIITFKPEYVKTLDNGEHTVRIIFNDGYSVAKWNIVSHGIQNATGDSADKVPFVLLIIAAGAAVVVLLVRRRRGR